MVNLRAFVRFDVEICVPEGIGSVPPYPCAIPEPSSNRTRPTLLFSSLLHKKPNHSIELSLCSRRDSNPYLQNRNLKFYPLNYGNGSAKIFNFSDLETASPKIFF